jgi:hypothetical protein
MVMEDAGWAVMEAVQDELLDTAVVAFALKAAVVGLTEAPEVDVERHLAVLHVRDT